MELCSNGHDEICYESRNCPVCEIIKDRDYFEEELNKLEQELKAAKHDIANLEEELGAENE